MSTPIAACCAESQFTDRSWPVGSLVGAGRWPYSACHPDCWTTPLVGVVLATNDVRAWTDTIRFAGVPAQADVDEHVRWCQAQPWYVPRLPVAWTTTGGDVVVQWQSPADLVTPQQDLDAWHAAREAQHARVRGDRLAQEAAARPGRRAERECVAAA